MLMIRNKRLRQVAGILESGNLLFLRLLLSRRPGAREYPSAVFREYMQAAGGGRWRCESIFDFVPELATSRPRIVLEHLPGESLNAPINELALLALVTRAVQPTKVFEIGTFMGRTALNFALNSPDDCTVYTLDLPPGDAASATGANAADAKLMSLRDAGVQITDPDVGRKIEQIYGDSTTFDFSPYFSEIDIVFVDGGHTYDVAASDTKQALKMCRPGGVIMWHDFANYGDYNDVTRAVLDHLPEGQVVQLENTQLAAWRSGP